RDQRVGNRLPHGRRADHAASRLRVPVPERRGGADRHSRPGTHAAGRKPAAGGRPGRRRLVEPGDPGGIPWDRRCASSTLGYTTPLEAAVTPLGARHTLEEFHDTPVLDKGVFVLVGNNLLLYRLLQEGRREELRHALAWWLKVTKAYAPKLVNPGGDEMWK